MMTTHVATQNAFTLTATEGRTPQPLNIMGSEVFVKVASADTDGAFAIFNHAVAPAYGPPLHRHSREDEWFYVLNGEITLETDGQRIVLRKGDSAFAPRGTVHTYKNFTNAVAEILVLVTPGAFNQLFEELSLLDNQVSASNPAEIEQLANKYGIEILGPPLA
jgi:quercetin dioxygenase-like cupin family protein